MWPGGSGAGNFRGRNAAGAAITKLPPQNIIKRSDPKK